MAPDVSIHTARCCPTLADLPPAPVGKHGWPWTEERQVLPATMPGGSPWPLLTIVTPSFQQAQFLEETIRSVLLQGYPNLEYLLIDGGSTDGSVEVIQKYSDWIAAWVSEKDRGQSHAINKGIARATGDIVAWLNSDDTYQPGAFLSAILALQSHPDCAVVYADGIWSDEQGQHVQILKTAQMDARKLLTDHTYVIPQPTVFMRRTALEAVGGLDESLHMAMDLDLWLKLALRYKLHYIVGKPLATLRLHASQKTQTRLLEDRLDSLTVIQRALRDPRCPSDISSVGSRTVARLMLDAAEIYLSERHDQRNALRYFLSALTYRPLGTIQRSLIRLALRSYWAIIPPALQSRIRQIRGTEAGALSALRY